MRVSTLSAVCAAALVLPASAAPLSETTMVVLPVVGATVTLELKGPSELPNAPISMPNAPQPTLPTEKSFKSNRLSKSKLARLPRAADFRQADYGVNPNVTFSELPVVQNVEATPSGTAPPVPLNTHRRRSEEDWEAARLKPDAYYSEADSAASGDISDAAAPSTGISPDSDAAAAAPSVAAAPVKPPVKVSSLQDTKPGDLPVTPDLSTPSQLLGSGVHSVGASHYEASYATHDALGAMFSEASPAMAQSNAVAKGGNPIRLGKAVANPKPAPGLGSTSKLLRRVLEPSTYTSFVSTPLRRAAGIVNDVLGLGSDAGLGKNTKTAKAADPKRLGVQSHDLQLSTDPVVPDRPDPTLNMSDPYVAAEEARRRRVGMVNIDSNRPGVPPPAPLTTEDLPANVTATNGTVGAVDKETKSEKKEAGAVQLDKAAKNATAVA
ncbi:hypothetical protein PYCCODRAFT_1431105 [Trametes coccinea BRFM310]|uniref:Uncharacterized protein n=1 Tax=Trametes coccinea (strain BRFM310) TaxID=1353009 RepID=A0A1Y2J0K8_TRAC3|nr:hypothetical protein PYCCODRAFT_1431105 [Trametes coccinea BRFM310]